MAWNQNFSQDINVAVAQSLIRRGQLWLSRNVDDLDMAVNYLHRSFHQAKLRHERKQLSLKSRSDDEKHLNKVSRPLSSKAMGYLKHREYGFSARSQTARADKEFSERLLPDFVSQHLPSILKEHEYDLGTINKVFASKWLNDSQIVFGTKCNKLLVLDLKNHASIFHIQSLKSSPHSVPASCPCGIHSIAINPSHTMLVTGGKNTNDLAVYELPTFDPLCVGEGAHKDWIFDMEWLDDQHIVTGSRDSTLALWHVDGPDGLKQVEQEETSSAASLWPSHKFITHRARHICQEADKVRALAVSHNKGLMGVLSMNAKFHHWDIETFTQLDSVNLRWEKENVCMANSDDLNVFAVGSQKYVTTLDHRDRRVSNWVKIPCSFGERGIRSLSFNQNMITIGTADGRVLFHDTRTNQYLTNGYDNNCELLVGDGWLQSPDHYQMYFSPGMYSNALYTHCYDENKTRLFVAGGPLPAQLYGNYAGLYY